MFLLGLILPVLMIPGFAGAAVSPRWALLSVALPIMFLLPEKWKTGHSLLVLFVFWSAITLFWAINPYEGFDQVWKFVVLALAGFVAAQQVSLRSFFVGLSIGMGVNSLVAIAQFHFGVAWVSQMAPDVPSGFFFNRNLLGEAAALVLVGALAHRLWWGAVFCVPSIVYSGCRGAILALFVAGVFYLWEKRRFWALVPAIVGVTYLVTAVVIGQLDSSFFRRMLIWLDVASSVSAAGHGVGSFYTAFQLFMDRSLIMNVFVEHAHNDYAQMLFELGIIGLLLFTVLIVLGCLSPARERYIVIIFAIEAATGFPTYLPMSAFIAFACLGFCLCRGDYLQHVVDDGRILLRSWCGGRAQRAASG